MKRTIYSKKKKIISLLIAAVMLAALVAPLSVAAAETLTVTITPTTTSVTTGVQFAVDVTVQDSNPFPNATVSLACSPSATLNYSSGTTDINGECSITVSFAAGTPAGTYTLTATATKGDYTGSATVQVYVSGKSKEAAPAGASIDYINNRITGLAANAKYRVNGVELTSSSSGNISLSSFLTYDPYYYGYYNGSEVTWDSSVSQWRWWDYNAGTWRYSSTYPDLYNYGYYGYGYGYSITIVKVARDSGWEDSDSVNLAYYNPNYSSGYYGQSDHLSASSETGYGYNDGYIYGMASGYTYEYKLSSEPESYYRTLSRSSSNSTRSVNLAPGTYDVRVRDYYYYSSYYYYTQTLTIYSYGYTGTAISVTAPAFSAEYYTYVYRPSGYLSLYNNSSQTAYISSVTVSGSAFDIIGSESSIAPGSSLSSSYSVQPRSGLSVGAYTETITVTYRLGSGSTTYTSSTQVSFTVLNDYYYDNYYYYYGAPVTSTSTVIVDKTTVSGGAVNGLVSYYNQGDTSGNVNVTVSENAVIDALNKMKNERSKYGRSIDSLNLELNFTTAGGYSANVNAQLSSGALRELINASANLTIMTDMGSITFPSGALRTINSGSTTGCLIKIFNEYKLSDSASTIIGGRPCVEFSVYGLKSGGSMTQISNFSTGVTGTIKYTPGSNEKTANLGIYKISNGNANLVANSSYSDGVLMWTGSSLSLYAVGYKRPAPEFADTAGHWAKSSIEFVASRGILTGNDANEFSPNTQMTRAMFVTALGRLSGETIAPYGSEKSFSDVDKSSTYHAFIEWAYANNIITRDESGNFEPNRSITREEIAVMMYRYASYANYKLPSKSAELTFKDADEISAGAKAAIKALQMAEVMPGRTGGVFDPQGTATRAEASGMLQRFIVNVVESASDRGWIQGTSTGKWQYINNKGAAEKGWVELSGSTYYFNTNGYMTTGWLALGANKYYFEDNGSMVKSKWLKIGSDWYYFYDDGALAVNTTVGGYKVDSTGARK